MSPMRHFTIRFTGLPTLPTSCTTGSSTGATSNPPSDCPCSRIIFLLLVAASSYTEVYVSYIVTQNFLYVPMFILLNIVMLYSVVKMRFAIKSMPNLFPNENLVSFTCSSSLQ